MYIIVARVVCLAIFVACLLTKVQSLPYIHREEVQLFLGATAIFVALFLDLWTGMLLMASLFVVYYRINKNYVKRLGWFKEDVSTVIEVPSLSDEMLVNAQNNVYSEDDFKKELIGFSGVHGEEVYGAQGMNTAMPGIGDTTYEAVLQD